MKSQSIERAIKMVYERLHHNGVTWALVGSTNMMLQGMEVKPCDVDIVIQHKDLERVRNLFSDCSVSTVKQFEKSYHDKPAWEVKATVDGVEVQFFGGDENETYVGKLLSGRIVYVKVDGAEVPCFTLDAESQAYRETSRTAKAALIKEFLDTRDE